MSLAGLFVGVGDAAAAENRRREKAAADTRERFAEDLRRVAESEDWPEQARITAAQMRHRLFSDQKLKPKEYEKMWEQVRLSSARPGQESAEVNAARSEIPALASLRNRLQGNDGVPVAQPDGLTMRPQMGDAPMDLLRPSEPGMPGTSSFMNMRPPQQEDNLITPRSMSDAAGAQLGRMQQTVAAAPPPLTVYGPRTRAEKNMEMMEMFRQQQGMQLDTYGKQKEIDAKYAKAPEVWRAHGGVLYNEATGDERKLVNYAGTPENRTELESLAADFIAANGMDQNNPNHRITATLVAKAKLAAAARDNEGADAREERWARMFELQTARFDQAERLALVNQARDIRRDFETHVMDARKALLMTRDLQSAAEDVSKGGDFMAMYALIRAVDPNSVVREGEVRLLQSMQSVWAKMDELKNRWVPGNPALAEEARRMAVTAARLIKEASRGKFDEAIELAEYNAVMRGVQPGLIGLYRPDPNTFVLKPVTDYEQPTLPQPRRPQTPTSQGGHFIYTDPTGPPVAGGDKPSGSKFMDSIIQGLRGSGK